MESLHTIPNLYIEWLKYPLNIFSILRRERNISILFTMFRNKLSVLFQQYEREVYLQGMDINGLQVIRMRRKLENIDKRTGSATGE